MTVSFVISTLTAPKGVVIAALITGALTAAVAVVNAATARRREDDARRRDLYSEAYRTALKWCEGVYRVRRRATDATEDRALVEHFHKLQEEVAYYEGWLATESWQLGAAYRTFLNAVMKECEPLLKDAWSRPGRPPTEETPADEIDPNISAPKEVFIEAVRRHMAPWWNPQNIE